MSPVEVKHAGGKTVLGVKVVPGSSRTAMAGTWNGMLKVKLAASPEKGKANKALLEFIAAKLGLKARDVAIVSGETNPVKHIELPGTIEESVIAELARDK
jgi:uncharacterized protein